MPQEEEEKKLPEVKETSLLARCELSARMDKNRLYLCVFNPIFYLAACGAATFFPFCNHKVVLICDLQ